MTNTQRVGGLAMMAVFLGLLAFVNTMWETGRLTYAIIGLVIALVVAAVAVAYWQNSDAVIEFFQSIPGVLRDFFKKYWSHVIGLTLVVGMVWVGGGMIVKMVRLGVEHEEMLTAPIASPTSRATSSTVSVQTDTVQITKVWSEWERVPLGGSLNSGRVVLGFDYEAQTASGEIYQAVDGQPIVDMEDTDRVRYRIKDTASTESERLELLRTVGR